jgi:hypothetical protein
MRLIPQTSSHLQVENAVDQRVAAKNGRKVVSEAVYKRGKIWWYGFNWHSEAIRESTKQNNKRVAEQIEAAHKTSLAKGEVGIKKKERAPRFEEFATRFTAAIETSCAEKPATIAFYKSKLKVLVDNLGERRLDEIEEGEIERYTQLRANTESRRACRFPRHP